jgi:hypothetical protein
MKLAVGFLLILFTSYIATPTILSLIDNGNEVSLSITAADGELDEFFKFDLKSEPILFFFLHISETNKINVFKNILKRNFLSYSIFIPPPELN